MGYGINGTPWHVEIIGPTDEKRNKSRCIYFSHTNGRDGHCSIKCCRCTGSSHCDQYRERSLGGQGTDVNIPPRIEKPRAFQGIKKVKMSDISLGNKKWGKPSKDKVEELLDYYLEQGELDKPVLVSCKGDKYILEDKYLRWYVANELGLKEIDAQFGSERNRMEEELRKVGTKVYHNPRLKSKSNGSGTVIKVSLHNLWVAFDNGETVKYTFPQCIDCFALN